MTKEGMATGAGRQCRSLTHSGEGNRAGTIDGLKNNREEEFAYVISICSRSSTLS